MRPRRLRLFPVLLLALASCNEKSSPRIQELEQQVLDLTRQLNELRQGQIDKEETIATLSRQVVALQGLGADRLEHLVVPVRIELGRLSGGVDKDGIPGDDGIQVYVTPIDVDGDKIKSAGDIYVKLIDNTQPDESRVLGQYQFDAAHLRKLWYSDFMTNHYSVFCPWEPGAVPVHREVTVRASFTDLLTGAGFSETKVCTVELPPTVKPAASAPASSQK